MRRTFPLIVAAIALLGGCLWGTVDANYRTQDITYDGTGRYDLTALTDAQLTPDGSYAVQLSAALSNTGDVGRGSFERKDAVASQDEQVCATWTSVSSISNQDGFVLRVDPNATTAPSIVMTDNIYPSGVSANFNFYWPGNAIDIADQSQLGDPLHFPVRICTRVIGTDWSFKAWYPDSQGEPDWIHAVTLATTDVRVGVPGWYVAHIQPGGVMALSDMTSAPLDTTTTTSTTTASTTTASTTTASTTTASTTAPPS